MNYGEFSYKVLHNIAKKYSHLFKGIQKDLFESGISYSLEEYFASMLMTLIISLISIPIFSIIFFILLNDILLSIVSALIFYLVIAVAIITIYYFYPAQKVNEKRKKIENALHFATIYMETLAGTGAPPYVLFKILGSFEEFSEISAVARKISRDIEIFGMDPAEAISRAAEKSPSPNLRELLWGMKATITSGGDLKEYLSEKARAFTQEYKRKLEEFTKVLAILLEIYITVVIVGSVLMIVLTTIMSLISGELAGIPQLQLLMVVVGLPLMSTIFILIIKSSSPTEV